VSKCATHASVYAITANTRFVFRVLSSVVVLYLVVVARSAAAEESSAAGSVTVGSLGRGGLCRGGSGAVARSGGGGRQCL
jgi:hypothetical protein